MKTFFTKAITLVCKPIRYNYLKDFKSIKLFLYDNKHRKISTRTIRVLITFGILFSFLSGNAQFKEIRSFHENGNPKEIVYKNDNLQDVKIEEYDENNINVSFYNIDPQTKKNNGEFFNTTNHGYFNQGEINCDSCVLNFGKNNYTQVIGNFVNGRPKGKLTIYSVAEENETRYQPYTSYALSMSIGQRINYYTYIGSGRFKKTYKLTLNYNDDGYLNGPQEINKYTTLLYNNGELTGFSISNPEASNVMKDSVHKSSKIWKVNNQFIFSGGLLSDISWNEFENPWEFNYTNADSFSKIRYGLDEMISFIDNVDDLNYSEIENQDPYFYASDIYFTEEDHKTKVFRHVFIEYKHKTRVLDETNGVYNLIDDPQLEFYYFLRMIFQEKNPNSEIKFPEFSDGDWNRFNQLCNQITALVNSINSETPILIYGSNGLELFLKKYTHGGDGPGHYVDVDEFLEFIYFVLTNPNTPIENVYILSVKQKEEWDDSEYQEYIGYEPQMNEITNVKKWIIEQYEKKKNKEQAMISKIDDIYDSLDLHIINQNLDQSIVCYNRAHQLILEFSTQNIDTSFASKYSFLNNQYIIFKKQVERDRIERDRIEKEVSKLIKRGEEYSSDGLLFKSVNSYLIAKKMLTDINDSLYILLTSKIQEIEWDDFIYFIDEIGENKLSFDYLPELRQNPNKELINKKYGGITKYLETNSPIANTGYNKVFSISNPKSSEERDFTLKSCKTIDEFLTAKKFLIITEKQFLPTGILYKLKFSKKPNDDLIFSKDELRFFYNEYKNDPSRSLFIYHNFMPNEIFILARYEDVDISFLGQLFGYSTKRLEAVKKASYLQFIDD